MILGHVPAKPVVGKQGCGMENSGEDRVVENLRRMHLIHKDIRPGASCHGSLIVEMDALVLSQKTDSVLDSIDTNSPHSLAHSPSLHPHDPTHEDLCHHLLFLYVLRE